MAPKSGSEILAAQREWPWWIENDPISKGMKIASIRMAYLEAIGPFIKMKAKIYSCLAPTYFISQDTGQITIGHSRLSPETEVAIAQIDAAIESIAKHYTSMVEMVSNEV